MPASDVRTWRTPREGDLGLRAISNAAGLHVSRLDGSPLVYNRSDPYLPDLLICRPEYAQTALEVCA